MIARLARGAETIEVPCTVEIEQTSESLHAHVELDGDIEIRPGDEVIVHDAPTEHRLRRDAQRAPHGHGHARQRRSSGCGRG